MSERDTSYPPLPEALVVPVYDNHTHLEPNGWDDSLDYLELRGPHARLHNNWRADLNHIAEELGRDDTHLIVA